MISISIIILHCFVSPGSRSRSINKIEGEVEKTGKVRVSILKKFNKELSKHTLCFTHKRI
jgi:hypothetical protein